MKVENRNGLKVEVFRLLVIEGSDVYFEYINGMLEKSSFYLTPIDSDALPQQFHVSRCKTIATGLEKLKDISRDFDAILVSNRARIRSDRDAISNLIRFAGAAPLLLLTTLGDNDNDIRQCLESGVVSYISIPSLRHEGTEFLANTVLDAIAIRRGGFAKEVSQVEACTRVNRQGKRIRQVMAILVLGVVIFIVTPSFRDWTLTVDFFYEEALANFFKGSGAILSSDVVTQSINRFWGWIQGLPILKFFKQWPRKNKPRNGGHQP